MSRTGRAGAGRRGPAVVGMTVAVVPALVAALLGAALVGVAVSAAPPARAASPTACRTPFTAAFVASLRRSHPGQRVTASVYDTRTHCWYSLNPGTRITTASMIKAGVMGAVLLRAQDRGRGLTTWERARTTPMIRYSDNNPYVSDLLGRVGGVPA